VSRVNRALAEDVVRGRFMTLFYLEVNDTGRQMRWVSAGHDPALLFSPVSSEVVELEGEDLPLGVDAQWSFHECGPVELGEGQVVVLGTDGIWEQTGEDGHPFGKQTLRELISRNAFRSAAEIAQAILSAHERHRGSIPQGDDIAIVVLKVPEGEALDRPVRR
jgi:sigma-B regulation protein RsbU (phosphoserine phosphatase)